MGEDPLAIRQEIEDTRVRMGETVEALAYKTDVRSRAQDAVVQLRGRAAASADATRRRLGDRATLIAAAATVAAALTAGIATVLMGRSIAERRHEHLARPAKRLPEQLRRVAVPAARQVDHALVGAVDSLQGAADSLQQTRQRALRSVSDEIARALADEQERRNPFWRRVTRDAGSAAATTAATLVVRRAVAGIGRNGRADR